MAVALSLLEVTATLVVVVLVVEVIVVYPDSIRSMSALDVSDATRCGWARVASLFFCLCKMTADAPSVPVAGGGRTAAEVKSSVSPRLSPVCLLVRLRGRELAVTGLWTNRDGGQG